MSPDGDQVINPRIQVAASDSVWDLGDSRHPGFSPSHEGDASSSSEMGYIWLPRSQASFLPLSEGRVWRQF